MNYINLIVLEKIYNILRYGLICDYQVFKVYSLSYDEYIHEYVFYVDDHSYFLLSDLDIFYEANLGGVYEKN